MKNESTETLKALSSLLPETCLSIQEEDLQHYGTDWTRVHTPAPLAVVFPRDTKDVQAVIRLCKSRGLALVPSGGRTGLAGGAVARDGELVLSLERLNHIGTVDVAAMTLEVGAGAITEAVHGRAKEHGLVWPVDFASKGSSQIGGNISTNAGGVRVIRYGLTRNWVLGLTVVTPEGEILELNGALEKNNTGLDLRQLFIGTEGTLGVITGATLKLTREPEHLNVLLLGLRDLNSVLELFAAARRGPFTIMAFEMFTDRCLRRLARHRDLRSPLDEDCPYYALLEVEDAEAEDLMQWLEPLLESDWVLDGTMAANRQQANHLWSLREGISESLSATGLPHKNDIALPISGLQAFCADLEKLFAERYPDWEVCLFGHIGDGNLHVNVMKPDGMEKQAFLNAVHDADRGMFELVRAHGGSVSAEHGIGLLKRDWLDFSRSSAELRLMRQIKGVLDPDNLLNPGKILSPG